MSDTPDPFAARPYVPPTDRPGEESPAPAAESAAGTPTEPTAATPAEPPAEPTVASANDSGDAFTHRFEPSASEYPTAGAYATESPATATATLPPVPPGSGPALGLGDVPPPRRAGVAGLLAAALIGGAAGIGGSAIYETYLTPESNAISVLESEPEDLPADAAPVGNVERVAALVLPSVVQINVSSGNVGGKGSGIIISTDGEILTNNHVIEVGDEDGGSIMVAFNDGSTAKAKLLGRDPLTDTAVIKVDKPGLRPAKLGSSDNLRIGQPVVALGSPFGLNGSVTTGIVSALNRPANFAEEDGSAGAAFPSIQTDAAINPGNSGGPITDMQGRVVGISTGIAASLGGGFDGVAFALPIDLAKNVAKNLIQGKKIEHARIGITVAKAVADDKVTQIGAEIREVQKGSAGAKAGLQVDDIVTAVDNHLIATNDALIATIRGYQPGETVTITYLRDGKKRTTEVTLDSDGGKLGQ